MGYVYYVNPNGSNGTSYAGSYFNSSHGSGGGGATVTLPVIKINDKLTGKAKCLNALLNANGSFVQKLLSNFAGISEYDIDIISVPNVFVSGCKN